MLTTELTTSSTIAAGDTIVSNVSDATRKVTVATMLNSEGYTDDLTQSAVNDVVDEVFAVASDPDEQDDSTVTQEEVDDLIDRLFP